MFPRRRTIDLSKPHTILVDVSNVVGGLNDGSCRLNLYYSLKKELRQVYPNPTIYGVADYRLKHHIDWRSDYYELLKCGEFIQSFQGLIADDIILGILLKIYGAHPGYVWVVSNDYFHDHKLLAEIRQYLIRFQIEDDGFRLINGILSELIAEKRILD